MDHAQPLASPFPWRAVAVVVGAVALVELVALIGIGLVRLTPGQQAAAASSRTKAAAPARHVRTPAARRRIPSVPLRPRSAVRVLVLNGNGVGGAAAAEAARLHSHGYRISGAKNAQRHDYARSMVMFVPGWIKEARRLARDTGIRMVAPVDGLRPAQLRRSKIILLLGR